MRAAARRYHEPLEFELLASKWRAGGRNVRCRVAAPRQCCDRYTGYCSVHRGPFHRNASLCLEFANPWPADVWTVFGTPAAWAAAGASPWLGAGGALPLPTVSLQAVALRRGEDGGASVVCEGFSTELAAPLGAVCRNTILRCPALPIITGILRISEES